MPYMTWDGSSFTKRGELAPANHSVKALALQFVDKLALWQDYLQEKEAYEEWQRTEDAFNIHQGLPQSPAVSAQQEAEQQAREAAAEAARQAKKAEIAARWAKVCLPEALKENIRQLGDAFVTGESSAAQGILLYGPPGTGKSLIARTLADTLDCAFIAVTLHDLKGRYIGESGQKVKEVWEKAKSHSRCILFIDECESIFVKRGSTGSDSFTDDIVQAFIAEWDGFDKQQTVLILGATNRRDIMDEAVLSRFAEQIEIPLPDAAMRQSIFAAELAALGWQGELPETASDYLQGFSGREIANLSRQMMRNGGDINEETLAEATRSKRTIGNNAIDKNATWDKLVLNDSNKKILHSASAMFANAETLRNKGINIPRGILLYGPPGTGKTQIARTMANESGLSFIGASTADMKAGYTGQSGQLVKELFARARSQTPCILFIDEMDIIAPARGGADDAFTKEIVGQLLQELDGIKNQSGDVFVLAATNRPEDIDSALLSRFNRRIEIGLPDAAARAAILRVLLANKPVAFDLEEGCATLAARSDGQSGRDLRNRVERAEQNAIVRHLDAGDIDGLQLELADFD
ncbi:ATP-binding protein [Cardiobacterium hominis]|nr:ATP-binding protein [Cardiobacterium hominis]